MIVRSASLAVARLGVQWTVSVAVPLAGTEPGTVPSAKSAAASPLIVAPVIVTAWPAV